MSTTREELLIQQQIKLIEEKERKRKEAERRAHQKKMKKLMAKPEWISKMQNDIPECIEFRPSEEDFNSDPLRYIQSIAHLAAPFGACKIIPPASFRPECVPSMKTVQTKLQTMCHKVDDFDCGGVAFQTSHKKGTRQYSIEEYQKIGQKRFKEVFDQLEDPGERAIEAEFWHTMSSAQNFSVQYGSDVEGTACQESFGAWDLRNFGHQSLLGLVDNRIPGVTAPMMYIGMLFAHFCWHYEDNALYSINYNHGGSPKMWYVSPVDHAEHLEKTIHHVFRNHPDRFHPMMSNAAKLLMRKTVMCSPSVLMASGVPVYRCTQREREFVVTMPRGYHSGFNTGLHIGEAVNFALPCWIPYGFLSLQRYRATGSMSCLDIEKMICKSVALLSEEDSAKLLREGKNVCGCNTESLALLVKALSLLVDWQANLVAWAERQEWRVVPMDVWRGPVCYDRQLCGACNHICHMAFVQTEGNMSETRKMCPEHSAFLGPGRRSLHVRYPLQNLYEMMSKADSLLKECALAESHKTTVSTSLRPFHGSDVKSTDTIRQDGLGGECEVTLNDRCLALPHPDDDAQERHMDVHLHQMDFYDTPEPRDTALSPNESTKDRFEIEGGKFVLRGLDGKVLDIGPACPGQHGGKTSVEDQPCPKSPLYFVDKFPSLEDLLQTKASRFTVAFRKHLLEQKPDLASLLPDLYRLTADIKSDEKIVGRKNLQPSADNPERLFVGSRWRCKRIVEDESQGILRMVCRRKLPRVKDSVMEDINMTPQADGGTYQQRTGPSSSPQMSSHEIQSPVRPKSLVYEDSDEDVPLGLLCAKISSPDQPALKPEVDSLQVEHSMSTPPLTGH